MSRLEPRWLKTRVFCLQCETLLHQHGLFGLSHQTCINQGIVVWYTMEEIRGGFLKSLIHKRKETEMITTLKTLGLEIESVDRAIMDLVQKRILLARQVGFSKYIHGEEIARLSVEDSRIVGIRQYADTIGLNPHLAASLLYVLIAESCKEQMIQMQRGGFLKDNIMRISEYATELLLNTKTGTYKAYHLMPKTLSADDKDFIFSLIYPVAQSAFGQEHSEKFAHDVRSHALDHTNILIVQDEGGNVIAFRVWDVFSGDGKDIVYLAGMCVLSEHQKAGLGKALIQAALDRADTSHPDWSYVVLRTQNWAMQKSMASVATASGVYKKFGDTGIDTDLQGAAKIVANKINDPYIVPSELVSRNIYGGSLYGSPRSYQDGFVRLNVANGDAAYCVWRR